MVIIFDRKYLSAMKRKMLYAAGFILMAVSLTSCEEWFNDCEVCKQVTYENGNVINQTSGTEYCGTQLLAIKATPPVTIGNTTTQWECN